MLNNKSTTVLRSSILQDVCCIYTTQVDGEHLWSLSYPLIISDLKSSGSHEECEAERQKNKPKQSPGYSLVLDSTARFKLKPGSRLLSVHCLLTQPATVHIHPSFCFLSPLHPKPPSGCQRSMVLSGSEDRVLKYVVPWVILKRYSSDCLWPSVELR